MKKFLKNKRKLFLILVIFLVFIFNKGTFVSLFWETVSGPCREVKEYLEECFPNESFKILGYYSKQPFFGDRYSRRWYIYVVPNHNIFNLFEVGYRRSFMDVEFSIITFDYKEEEYKEEAYRLNNLLYDYLKPILDEKLPKDYTLGIETYSSYNDDYNRQLIDWLKSIQTIDDYFNTMPEYYIKNFNKKIDIDIYIKDSEFIEEDFLVYYNNFFEIEELLYEKINSDNLEVRFLLYRIDEEVYNDIKDLSLRELYEKDIPRYYYYIKYAKSNTIKEYSWERLTIGEYENYEEFIEGREKITNLENQVLEKLQAEFPEEDFNVYLVWVHEKNGEIVEYKFKIKTKDRNFSIYLKNVDEIDLDEIREKLS